MKKNVFTKNIKILIIALIILTVILPKEHSQTGMIIFLAIWLTGNLVFKLLNHKESIVVFFRNKKNVKKQTINTPNPMPDEAKIPTPHPVPESKDITLTETHADITFDRFNRIHIEPMSIGTFTPNDENNNDEEQPKNEPPVVDVKAWYELIGQRVLDAQITELNANGHNRLTIKENGDIVINRQKKEVYLTSLETFPGKNYWQELVSLLEENDLTAKIAGNSLQISWV